MGNPRALLAATKELLRRDKKSFGLGANVEVGDQVTLLESYVGDESSIGASSTVQNSIIGRGCHIGQSVHLIDSFVADGYRIPDGVIAQGEFFGF